MKSNEKNQTSQDLFVKIQDLNSELESTNPGLPPNVSEVITGKISVWKTSEDDQTPINPWDSAHQACAMNENISYAEPNLEQTFFHQTKFEAKESSELEGAPAEDSLAFDQDWPPFDHQSKSNIWHLDSSHSQLGAAIEQVTTGTEKVIRIAHIDTGYDPNHVTFPKENIRFDLQRNYVDSDKMLDARDPLGGTFPFKHPGHGTGTLGILAGKAINQHGHTGPIGLTKNIEIVPIRIAERVALVKSDAFVRALQHILLQHDNPETRIHIVTMSMGGAASHIWKELINLAYDKGIFIVSAAGNNQGRKTPRTLLHPARFKRVIAACGVTHTFEPYRKVGLLNFEMQGNYGPRVHMETAMAAFTPNLPWAKAGTVDEVRLSGAGTSSATPQIAMAAALYYLKHYEDIEKLDSGWKKVETLRHALFTSSLKWDEVNKQKEKNYTKQDFELYFGRGILQASKMLKVPLPAATDLIKTEEDQIFLPFIRVFLGLESTTNLEMLELELLRVIQHDPTLQALLDNEEVSFEELDTDTQKLFLKHVLTLDPVSNTLKREVKYILKNIDL